MNGVLIFSSLFVIYILLIVKSGKSFPILYLFLFTYFLQYIFSVYLIYNEYDELKIFMPITQEAYFGYASYALFFLFLGVFLFNRDIALDQLIKDINSKKATTLGYLLVFISYFLDLIDYLGFSGYVGSILSFTSYLKYVGAFCFLFSNSNIGYLFSGLIYFQLLVIVVRDSVFIDFFVWSTYLFFFIVLKFQFPYWLRASFIVVAAPILVLVQSVKKDYRQATWSSREEANLETFSDFAAEDIQETSSRNYSQSSGVVSTVGRLSQGWHLAMTLRWVPTYQHLADGEEMLSDITSSFLPRIIINDKKMVGTQDKFKKYTGYKLRGATSMTIGVLGDFYVNFGVLGSFIMLFVFGAIISRLLYVFTKTYVLRDPIYVVWIPFMFSYLIRANNDFYMVFNCLVKGFLIFLFVDFIIKRIWKRMNLA